MLVEMSIFREDKLLQLLLLLLVVAVLQLLLWVIIFTLFKIPRQVLAGIKGIEGNREKKFYL